MLSWGIVGAGDIARKISAQAMKDARESRLVAVMHTDCQASAQFGKDFGVSKCYDTAKALIDDPEVNAVYLSTPVYLHCEEALLAAAAGKHVLVEKPMALTTTECAKMIEACDRGGVKLMVLFYQRFNALHQKLKSMAAAGSLGRVAAARSLFTQLSPPAPTASKWEWRMDPKRSGGGTLPDTGSHCIDTLRYVLGHEVVKVCGIADTVLFDYPVDDTTSCILQFDNGLQATVGTFWSSPDWDQSAVNLLEIYGEKGCAMTSPVNNKQSQGELRWNVGQGWEKFTATQNTHIAAIEAFRSFIEEGTTPPVTGLDGLINVKIMEAVYESSRQGKFIPIT